MDTIELFQRLSVALSIGLLIGLERGWHERAEPEGERAAGLRTFALSGLLGGIWGAIALRLQHGGGAVALGLAFLAFAAAIIIFRYREIVHDRSYGATTVVAAMLAFGLGSFALLGDAQAAGAFGVAATALLALKTMLHTWVRRLTWEELRSGLVILAMTFILLPLLPDRTIDRWNALNPHSLWLMTILIAALSFVGYVAIKVTGDDRGILLTGVAGGLVSSTAVTLSLSRLAREHHGHARAIVAGMLLANATMIARVLTIVGLVNADVLPLVAAPLVAAGVVLAGGAILVERSIRGKACDNGGLEIRNPFDLSTVLKLGALLTAITFAAKLSTSMAGRAGAYGLAAVSGLADVDAISLSMAQLAGGAISTSIAADAILIAIAVNTITKAALSWVVGGADTGRWMLPASCLAVIAGLAAYLAVG